VTPPLGGNPLEFLDTSQKLDGWGYRMDTVWRKFHNPNFNRLCMIHPSDRQTDRRTGDSIYAL